MPGRDHLWRRPLGRLDPVIAAHERHRQGLFCRRTGILPLGVDALESQVAAHHDEPATGRDIVPDGREAVGQHLRAGEGVGVEQQGIGADVGEEDNVIGREVLDREGELPRRDMGRLVGHLPAPGLERGPEPAHALGIFRGREAVEALLVDRMHCPGFPGDEDALGHERAFAGGGATEFRVMS